MALAQRTQHALKVALGSKARGAEVAAAVASGVGAPADLVAAIGASTNLTGVDGTGDNAADLATTEARLDAIEAKVNELIAALKDAGLVSAA